LISAATFLVNRPNRPMKTFAVFAALLLAFFTLPCHAGGKGKPPAPFYRIVEVDAASITVSVGMSGTKDETLRITGDTKITLNGAPAAARDLMAGMKAEIKKGSDPTIAASIMVKDAVARHPHGRVG
jgi:hypothetical protein